MDRCFDGLPVHELAALRDALPGWGIIYDPNRGQFIAVQGRRPTVTSPTARGLLAAINGRLALPPPDIRDWRITVYPGTSGALVMRSK